MLFQQSSSLLAHRPIVRHLLLFLLVMLGSYTLAYGQKMEKLGLSADDLKGEVIDGERCTKLRGNVILKLNELTITADSALHFYEKRSLIKAEGNIKIVYKDGAVVTANRLLYDEKTQLAQLRGQVVYKSDNIIFYTDHLDYQTKSKQGNFWGGGKLVEKTNVLTSERGAYNDVDKAATFEQQVKLMSKDYVVECDVLQYNTVTQVARFKGKPTHIRSQDGKQHLQINEWGEYNTESQQSAFEGGMIETKQHKLYGDRFVLDQAQEVYKVTGHVRLVDKEENIEISGDHAEYQKKKGIAKLHGNALMKKVLNGDPLYLSADAFVVLESRTADGQHGNVIKASSNVKIYKDDFQGKADAVVYEERDATFHFKGDTVFWAGDNQLTAEKAYVLLKEKMLHEMHMKTNVLVVAQDKAGNFNQLQSKQMIVSFKENMPEHVALESNVESVYYLLNEQDQLEGVSHLKCSQVKVQLAKSKIVQMTIPGGSCSKWEIQPPDKVPKELEKFANFSWRVAERPTKKEVIGRGYGTHEGFSQFKFDDSSALHSADEEELKK